MSDRKSNRQLSEESSDVPRPILRSSLITASAHQRRTSHAEELANRLIALSQLASERDVARSDVRSRSTCSNGTGESDDVPNTSPGQAGTAVSRPNNVSKKNIRKAPPPPPPRRRPSISVDNIEECFNSSSHSMRAEQDQNRSSSAKFLKESDKSEFTSSTTSLQKLKSLSSKDFNNSQSTSEYNTTSEAFSPNVRISQFDDELESVLESAESLPSQCDKKGRCVFHPNIKLYKKGLLGGFSLIMSKCPLCENVSHAATDSHQNSESNQKLTIRIKRSTSTDGNRSNSAQRRRSDSVGSIGKEKALGRRSASKKYKRSSSLTKKAMSENEAVCVAGGPAFFEESYRSINTNGSPLPRGKKLMNKAGIDGSPVSQGKKMVMNRARTDSDAGSRVKREDNSRSSEIKTSSLKTSRSSIESSHHDTPVSPQIRTKSKVRSDALDSFQGPTSMLDKGLKKLSLLKNRSSSRSKSTSDSLTNRSIGTETLASQNSKARRKGKLFDSIGRCKNHPSIILAKKRAFGNGWDMIRDYCPMCAESESEVHTSKMNRLLERESNSERVFPEINTSSVELTSSKFRSRSTGRMDASYRSGNSARSQSSSRFEQSAFDKMSSQVARVQKMPYTTPSKEFGWYTGEVNDRGLPNGYGRMRTKTGNTLEGNWINGCLEEHIDRIKKLKSGFGTNVAPWKQSTLSPHCDLNSSSRSMGEPSSREGHRRKPMGVPAQHLVQSSHQHARQGQMQHHSHWQDSQHYRIQQPQSYIPTQPPQGYYPTQQPLSYPAQQQQQSWHMPTQSSFEMSHNNSFSTYGGMPSEHFHK